ncbi:unnamed protein product [Arabis nemorensis]|uniref:Replication protein A OB domain-containing protein n=1 Tax=Arabis nemorensis TaxID=586526 RepID=A0A565BA76_9BRAS|nr:unnamed protein product [Arabis nemorensis]
MFMEMEWREVEIFKVINAIGVSDVVFNNHKIEIVRETIVNPTDYVNGNLFFSFVNYALKHYLIDVIGHVTDYGETTEINSFQHGPGYKKFTFEIENASKQRLSCVAWGEKAVQMSNIFSTLDSDMINVCILRFWKLDIHGGTEVHTSGERSQMMINPEIDEVDHFLDWMQISYEESP